ncbi:hypothetical protein [Methanoplanus endosymbiosus]|uniref:Uncharacterized protein n=1 Tax=Methanoplanus endosymbiosus TaxID=33865 RepID=A0A9E7PP14_9EURY|nr:hypothetical protein [Methanoplanus endosymbiosus]UUX93799.1 hypothetical protein L6E24_06710 [Methanoplanus endosymbiosus]
MPEYSGSAPRINDYYIPLEKKMMKLKEGILKSEEEEILNFILRKHSSEYGHTLFITENA